MTRQSIDAALPEDWNYEGKRLLDFGCEVGSPLRHFLDVAEVAEAWGCDIDRPSIECAGRQPLPAPAGLPPVRWTRRSSPTGRAGGGQLRP